jgi:hypothetical protein
MSAPQRQEEREVVHHRLNLLRNDIRLSIRPRAVQNVDRAIAFAADPTALSELKSVANLTARRKVSRR